MQCSIQQLIRSRPTSDGQGVKLQRALTPNMAGIDPFLLLDEIASDDRDKRKQASQCLRMTFGHAFAFEGDTQRFQLRAKFWS